MYVNWQNSLNSKQPGFERTRKIRTTLNRIRIWTKWPHTMYKWGLREARDCGHESLYQTISHVVNECPLQAFHTRYSSSEKKEAVMGRRTTRMLHYNNNRRLNSLSKPIADTISSKSVSAESDRNDGSNDDLDGRCIGRFPLFYYFQQRGLVNRGCITIKYIIIFYTVFTVNQSLVAAAEVDEGVTAILIRC